MIQYSAYEFLLFKTAIKMVSLMVIRYLNVDVDVQHV